MCRLMGNGTLSRADVPEERLIEFAVRIIRNIYKSPKGECR